MQTDGPSFPVEDPLLQRIRIIMEFVKRFHGDFQQGLTLYEYGQEFPLPNSLRDLIKYCVIQFEGSYLLQVYLLILTEPNPTDKLIDAFMNSFSGLPDNITDVNFIEWSVMCCLVSVVLNDNGFSAAPIIAVETIRGLCVLNGRQNAFRMFGTWG